MKSISDMKVCDWFLASHLNDAFFAVNLALLSDLIGFD